jgi:hypothetical protein
MGRDALRVLVCGGRDYDDYDRIRKVLDEFCDEHNLADNEYKMPNGLVIIQGGARGADSLAFDWAAINWVPIEEHKANWAKYGRAAGAIRNKQMLDTGIDVVIAFPGGRGTEHMKQIARKAGIEVREISA